MIGTWGQVEYFAYHKKSYYMNKCPKKRSKKLVLVLTTFMLLTETTIEANLEASMKSNNAALKLQQIICIHYLTQFETQTVEAQISLYSIINAMWPSFVEQLGLYI